VVDAERFDAMAKILSGGANRRRALSILTGGVLAGAGIEADAKWRHRAQRTRRRKRKGEARVQAESPVCRPGGACTSAADCCAGQTCRNGHCTGRPPLSCEQSEHCPAGESCVDGMCCLALGVTCPRTGPEDACCSGFCRFAGFTEGARCCGNEGDPCTGAGQCCSATCDTDSGQCVCGLVTGASNCLDDAHCCGDLVCARRHMCCRLPGTPCNPNDLCCGNTFCKNAAGTRCLEGEACACTCISRGAACIDSRFCCEGLACMNGSCG
jgi:hypothetical protein